MYDNLYNAVQVHNSILTGGRLSLNILIIQKQNYSNVDVWKYVERLCAHDA